MLRATRRPTTPPRARPTIESLEDRCLLSANVLQTNLVSDLPGVAQFQDPDLINPWGISESGGSPFWISDNNSGLSTLYNTAGVKQGLKVSIPTPGDLTGASGTPTGTVFNLALGSGGFMVTNGITSAAPFFLFATEDGTIIGWAPSVNPVGSDPAKAGTFATIARDNSGNNFTEPDPLKQTGAVYKGLAIATSATPIFPFDPNSTAVIYVTNFRSGQVEVYDSHFDPVVLPEGAFADPNIPKGYAPFNVQNLGGKIYVTYAQQDEARHDDVSGPGHGFVDVFNPNGTPGLANNQERLISRGPLDSPWGLALAPPSFGSLAGSLLVGNFGNGWINLFNPTTPGPSLGPLLDPDGEPIQIDGLWALKVGNGGAGGSANNVYFTAGIGHEQHGLFGSLAPVAPGTPEGPAEAQLLRADLDIVQLDFNNLVNDLQSGASFATLRQDLITLNTDLIDAVHRLRRFEADVVADSGGSGLKPEKTLEGLLRGLRHLLNDLD
jgi:uncharacterized protein (TIGR03118 family)